MSSNSEIFWRNFYKCDISYDLLLENIQRAMDRSPFMSHPLGFFRLHVGNLNGGPVYVHVWLPNCSVYQSDDLLIHSHSVAIKSYILLGKFIDERFFWVDDPSGDCCLFAQNREKIGPRLIRTDRLGFVKYNRMLDLESGCIYKIPFPEFHKIKINTLGPVVTVALFDGVTSMSPFVVASAEVGSIEDYKSVEMSPEDQSYVCELISVKIKELSSAGEGRTKIIG